MTERLSCWFRKMHVEDSSRVQDRQYLCCQNKLYERMANSNSQTWIVGKIGLWGSCWQPLFCHSLELQRGTRRDKDQDLSHFVACIISWVQSGIAYLLSGWSWSVRLTLFEPGPGSSPESDPHQTSDTRLGCICNKSAYSLSVTLYVTIGFHAGPMWKLPRKVRCTKSLWSLVRQLKPAYNS